ncbi:hypothetical protein L3V59_10610 [Burkholderia aenigmatica]|uniref:hypothetical protein n=1 Tax=Burkholderia aenigmatica TaxID=2015348 RepID=UPI001F231E25|nr:hypothetical protein [Burkholderia aenigmatica]UKD10167.1 hypothetical protein L3V59_10610 [Burkholderia aenigmatica]
MGARIGPPEGGQPAQIAPANDPAPNVKRPLAGPFRCRTPLKSLKTRPNPAGNRQSTLHMPRIRVRIFGFSLATPDQTPGWL